MFAALAAALFLFVPSNEAPEDIAGTWIANYHGKPYYVVQIYQDGRELRSCWRSLGGEGWRPGTALYAGAMTWDGGLWVEDYSASPLSSPIHEWRQTPAGLVSISPRGYTLWRP